MVELFLLFLSVLIVGISFILLKTTQLRPSAEQPQKKNAPALAPLQLSTKTDPRDIAQQLQDGSLSPDTLAVEQSLIELSEATDVRNTTGWRFHLFSVSDSSTKRSFIVYAGRKFRFSSSTATAFEFLPSKSPVDPAAGEGSKGKREKKERAKEAKNAKSTGVPIRLPNWAILKMFHTNDDGTTTTAFVALDKHEDWVTVPTAGEATTFNVSPHHPLDALVLQPGYVAMGMDSSLFLGTAAHHWLRKSLKGKAAMGGRKRAGWEKFKMLRMGSPDALKTLDGPLGTPSSATSPFGTLEGAREMDSNSTV